MIDLVLIFLSSYTVTSYRSVPEQTDSSPFITSTGERVHKHGVAVSQDLLKTKTLKYGDWVYIEGIGLKNVNDCMNQRHTNRLDVWVKTLKDEQEFHKKFKGKRLKVWKVNVVTKGASSMNKESLIVEQLSKLENSTGLTYEARDWMSEAKDYLNYKLGSARSLLLRATRKDINQLGSDWVSAVAKVVRS